jgi:glutathione synthase/RimK-type ligase-like ATP-grasp enzyme
LNSALELENLNMDNKSFRIAINKNDKIFHHSGSWNNPWIEYCQKNGVSFEIIDCYQPDIINKLANFNCLLWHMNNYVLQDMMIGRSILFAAKNMGLKIFPDYNTAWHFDDKIAETYLLLAAGAPIPNSWMFYLLEDCVRWLKNEAQYPIIAKLRSGSGSKNVKLFRTKNDGIKYARRMFRKGYKPYPSILFKAKSQFLSSKSLEVMKTRIKRIPEFFHTLSRAKMFPNEKGYVFFQEYIPNDGYDLKIVVIGDKLSFIGRNIRKGDFRASGGGDLFYEKTMITPNIISSAFSTNDKLGFQCMGYDYVVDKMNGIGKIVEISYGFSHTALLQAGGYYDRNGEWHNEPLDAPAEIIKNMMEESF